MNMSTNPPFLEKQELASYRYSWIKADRPRDTLVSLPKPAYRFSEPFSMVNAIIFVLRKMKHDIKGSEKEIPEEVAVTILRFYIQ